MGKKRNKKNKEAIEKAIDIKEMPFNLKNIKILEKTKEKSDLEREVSEDDIIFSPSTASENISPTLKAEESVQELPRQLTQFQKEDQSNFSQSISYSQNPYQIKNQGRQRAYQTSNTSGNRQSNVQQDQLMRSVQTNIPERQSQNSLLIPRENFLIQERESIGAPIISKELEHENESRDHYQTNSTDLGLKRKRVDMF